MDPAALTRSLTYIQAHLDGDLSLEALAAVAGCSSPYFARRFADVMAETPKQYTSRLRLERAALRLVLLDDGILEIALDCGFTCHETFSRAFHRRFGVAPQAFRREGWLPATDEQELPQRVDAAARVSLSSTVVRTLQPMSLAHIRHTGPYEHVPISLWDTLIDWARRHGILPPYVLLGIAHDAPGITAPEKLRFDAAIRVPGEFRSGRRVGHQPFAGGLFALTTNVGPFTSLPAAYKEIFRRVRHDRSLDCLGLPCLEFYRVNRVVADLAIVNTEIAIPVRRRH
ncbi:MAG: AraC family transcriptional regulator [Phycisphaerae bacterium]|nr:AraC family transcriptional regulator [Phycisphaerae bacterium]NUQ45444.1 AraC family transcriptional regulator [Phycisphaerae bacterium]